MIPVSISHATPRSVNASLQRRRKREKSYFESAPLEIVRWEKINALIVQVILHATETFDKLKHLEQANVSRLSGNFQNVNHCTRVVKETPLLLCDLEWLNSKFERTICPKIPHGSRIPGRPRQKYDDPQVADLREKERVQKRRENSTRKEKILLFSKNIVELEKSFRESRIKLINLLIQTEQLCFIMKERFHKTEEEDAELEIILSKWGCYTNLLQKIDLHVNCAIYASGSYEDNPKNIQKPKMNQTQGEPVPNTSSFIGGISHTEDQCAISHQFETSKLFSRSVSLVADNLEREEIRLAELTKEEKKLVKQIKEFKKVIDSFNK